MLRFWNGKKDKANLAKQDADELEKQFGTFAYMIARQRTRDVADSNRPDGHWDRVRNVLARRTGRPVIELES